MRSGREGGGRVSRGGDAVGCAERSRAEDGGSVLEGHSSRWLARSWRVDGDRRGEGDRLPEGEGSRRGGCEACRRGVLLDGDREAGRHAPNDSVAKVGDQEVAGAVHSDRAREVKRGGRRRATIAEVALQPISRNRGDQPRWSDLTNHIVDEVSDQ